MLYLTQTRMPTAIGLLCLALTLTACGKQQVLDLRNAEVVNGRIYVDGANTPFTGLLTNAEDMRTATLRGAVSILKKPVYQVMPDTSMSAGICDLEVKDGFLHGEVTCRQPRSNVVISRFLFEEGVPEGKAVLYQKAIDRARSEGVLVQATFKQGRLEGTQEVFSPTAEKLVLRQEFKNGVLDGKLVQYTPDGKTLIYTTASIGGLKDGVEESFNAETGKRTGRGEWKIGKPDGTFQQWDAAGNLVNDQVYRDGVLVEDRLKSLLELQKAVGGGLNTESCVDQWTAAHRKEVGPDAPIAFDQIDEWEQWCKEGKLPN